MEEILFERETVMDRAEIADYLRTVADRLAAGDPMTFEAGGDDLTVDPPARAEFEVKVEREREGGRSELGIEFELEWDEDGDDGDLSIS